MSKDDGSLGHFLRGLEETKKSLLRKSGPVNLSVRGQNIKLLLDVVKAAQELVAYGKEGRGEYLTSWEYTNLKMAVDALNLKS